MTKKKLHPRPTQYRIRYCINGSLGESTQYYNVFHSSEALDFLAHTYRRGHIHGGTLRILAVEEHDRFKDVWEDRTGKAYDHASSPEISLEGVAVVLKH